MKAKTPKNRRRVKKTKSQKKKTSKIMTKSKMAKAYQKREIPRIRVLIQDLDASGAYSLRGEHFSIISAEFEDVVKTVMEALMDKYATIINKSGKIIFVPYKEAGAQNDQEARCPHCGAIIGFDPHDTECPLHRILVSRWTARE